MSVGESNVSKEWEEYQQRTARDWINNVFREDVSVINIVLNRKGTPLEVTDLAKDVADGVVLVKLATIIEDQFTKQQQQKTTNAGSNGIPKDKRLSATFDGKALTQFSAFRHSTNTGPSSPSPAHPTSNSNHHTPSSEGPSAFRIMRQRDTVQLALGKLKVLGVSVTAIAAEDIVSGNIKMILALLWKIIRFVEDQNRKKEEQMAQEKEQEQQEQNHHHAHHTHQETQPQQSQTAQQNQQLRGNKLNIQMTLRKKSKPTSEEESASEDDTSDRKRSWSLTLKKQKKERPKIQVAESPLEKQPSQEDTASLSSFPTKKESSDKNVKKEPVQESVSSESPLVTSPTTGRKHAPKLTAKSRSFTWSARSIQAAQKPTAASIFNTEATEKDSPKEKSPAVSPKEPTPMDGTSPSSSGSFLSESPQSVSDSPLDDADSKGRSRSGSTATTVTEIIEQRDLVAREILSTEESYGKNLDDIVLVYFEAVKDACSETEMRTIFSNVQNLRQFSGKLQEELKLKIDTWTSSQKISDIFIKFQPFFKMYQSYCNNYEQALECLRNIQKREKADTILNNQKRLTGGLDLESLLITPIQRIPRYGLLLKEMVKHTTPDHPDYAGLKDALNKMLEIAAQVNTSMRQFQTAKAYEDLVESVKGILPFMEVHRKFVKESQYPLAVVLDRSKEPKFNNYWMILFSDMLFLVTGSNKQKRKLESAIKLETLWIKLSSKYDNCLEMLIPEQHSYYVRIVSNSEKKQWWDTLSDLISKARKTTANDESRRFFKYKFINEGVYEGDWVNAKMDGKGTYWFPNGNVYEGEMKRGLMEGFGSMKYIIGSTYEGEWKEGKQNGKGKLVSGTTVYQGQFKDGKIHGQGVLTYSNGDVYTGEFQDNKMHGQGKLVTKAGAEYDGKWLEDMMNGTGTFKGLDGSVYTGEFAYGKRYGPGKITYANGDTYQGQWKNGMKNGVGCLTTNTGLEVYNGQFVDDRKEGKGVFEVTKRDTDGLYLSYEGEWKDNKRHGQGTLTVNNTTYKGSWVAGLKEGQGTYTDCTGYYTGSWKADKKNGSGVFTSLSGVVIRGDWKDDVRVGRAVATYTTSEGKVVTEIYVDGKLETSSRNFAFGVVDLPMIPSFV